MKDVHRSAVSALIIMLLASLLLPTQAHAQGEAPAGEVQRVLVEFVPGQKSGVRAALQRQGAKIHYEFDELHVIAASLPAPAINGLVHNPNVLQVQEDVRRYAVDQTIPYGVVSVEASQVWDADADGIIDPGAPTGADRLVCIIDSGVDLDHEDFAGVNFVGGYPSDWGTDTCGHGTHVAGTIAAMNNSTGVVGVSPGTVSLYIVKAYGDNCAWTYSSDLISAANRCRSAGANIINMSLAGLYSSSYEDSNFQELYDAGILLVAAAGNNGGTAYSYPASYKSVISVAAVDQNNVVASFSRQNDEVELAAPGVNIYSTYMDGTYAYMSGTSMATPHVTSAAALVWSSDLSKTNAEIRTVLQQTALDLGPVGRDNAYGFGVVRSLQAVEVLNPTPTAVELIRFESLLQGRDIRLEWETASEIDNLGFNLYRADSADGPSIQLNGELIAGQTPGSPFGATYEFVDDSAVPGVGYWYWLEDVDVYGTATRHGPVYAQVPSKRRPEPPRSRPAATVASRSND